MSLLSPQLEAFVAITRTKTVHGAAEQLHITQTAVTQRIRTLESKLRTTLFIRTRRGMMLTPEGESLLRYCIAAQDIEGKTIAEIYGAGNETTISICITSPTSITRSRIMPALFNVMRQFPMLLINFDINDTNDRAKLLRGAEAQFAILQLEDVTPEMTAKVLQPEHYVLVCPAEWNRRKLRDIIENERIIDFNPTDEMTYNYLKYYDLFKYTKHERYYANSTDALATLIAEGFGYSVLTREFASDYVKDKQLFILNDNKSYENRLALAWYERHEPPAYFKAIVDVIE